MQRQDVASSVLLAAYEGVALSREEKDFLQKYSLAGFTLFRRNVPSSFTQLQQNLSSLQALAGCNPFFIAIDQEGGRVSRIADPFPNLGPPLKISVSAGAADGVSLTEYLRNYGFIVGASLKALGINVNFAPVSDIYTRPENTAIGDRCFGEEPGAVAEKSGAFMDGLQASGVYACLKHFPGQGDAIADTHLAHTEIDLSLDRLEEREIFPFRELMPRAAMLMMSHVVYSSYDHKPASLSKAWMLDYVREKLSYQGLIVSDDMNMKAMPQDDRSWKEAVVESLMAGVDLVLVCRHIEKCRLAMEAISDAMAKSHAVTQRLEDASSRVLKLRSALRR